MKVAVVYNDPNPDSYKQREVPSPGELNFEPYFDVEHINPLDGYEAIAGALRETGYEAYTLNIFDDFRNFLKDYHKNKPDIIFNMVEIYHDRAYLEMSFACLLELMKVPYTGAPPLALGTCQRKIMAKSILASLGINTPKFHIISKSDDCAGVNLKFPLIVKPSQEDASLGIENESVVNNHDELIARVNFVLKKFKQPVLVEEFIPGRELNVAVMGNKKPRVLPISEVDFSRMPKHLHNIVSFQAKWDPFHEAYHSTVAVCPAELPAEVEEKAKDLAFKAFNALGCRDYARVDMRLTENHELFVLEVNPNPDLTEDAGFMRSTRAAGYSFRRTLKRIVEFAWARREKAPAIRTRRQKRQASAV